MGVRDFKKRMKKLATACCATLGWTAESSSSAAAVAHLGGKSFQKLKSVIESFAELELRERNRLNQPAN